MIQVTLEFTTIAEAHAALGIMLIPGAPPVVLAPGVTPEVVAEAEDIANAADAAMEAKPEPKKRKPGRPKGSKDSTKIVRKGTKAAEALITLDSLRDDLQSFANEHGFKAARDILQQFIGGNGQPIKRIPDLQTDDYAKFQRALAKTPVEAEAEAS